MDDARSVTVDVLGTPVRISGPTAMIRRVADQWSRCRTAEEPDRTIDLLTWVDPDVREYTLVSGLNLLGIQLTEGRRLNLHAAGLSDDQGRVIALVAASGTGKTTAARVLGRTFGYVTDECVSVNPRTLDVHPYPKPLSLVHETGTGARDGTGRDRKRQVGPDELGLLDAAGPLRLRAVVLLDRRATVGDPQLRELAMLDAVELLLPQTSSAAVLPAPLGMLADLLARTGGARRLSYGEIDDAADLLLHGLVDAGEEPVAFEHLPGTTGDGEAIACPGLGRVAASRHHDAIVVGREALVMVGTRLVRTRGVATDVWRQLTRGDVAALGDLSPDTFVTVVPQLVEAGLVRRLEG